MNTSNIIRILILTLLFISCTQNQTENLKELQQQLTGLKKATTEDMVHLSPIKWSKNTEPVFYAYTGKKLNHQEYQQYLKAEKFIQVFYLDPQEKVKVVVLEPIDPEDTSLSSK